jgi:myo-inositol-1(or 4)-monophosphatase
MTEAGIAAALEAAAIAATAAGAIARQHFRTDLAVESKQADRFDPVTQADRAIESLLRARLRTILPDAGILGEEFGADGPDTDYWVVDPIDGTRSFISGMLGWGILIGLVVGGRPVAGLMHQPYTGETFMADAMHGARLRHRGGERLLRASIRTRLADAILYSTHPDLLEAAGLRENYATLARQCRLQRFGGDCYAYAMLACGQIDLVIEGGLAAYDIVPLVPIIEAAGGVVTTLQGATPLSGGTIVAAANATLHAAALAVLAG